MNVSQAAIDEIRAVRESDLRQLEMEAAKEADHLLIVNLYVAAAWIRVWNEESEIAETCEQAAKRLEALIHV